MVSFTTPATTAGTGQEPKTPLRGALVIGGATEGEVLERAREIQAEAAAGWTPPRSVPADTELRAAVRLAIDFDDAAELAAKADRAIKAMEADQPAMWRASQPGRVPRPRDTDAGGLPLHRSGLAVREHAGNPPRGRPDRRRHLRRGGHGDDAAARPSAQRATCSSIRPIRPLSRRPTSSCARPRSRSRRSSPWTSPSLACWPRTASSPRW